MEALMEKLIEVVYYQQEARIIGPQMNRSARASRQEDNFRIFEEEHLSEDENLTLSNNTHPSDIEIIDDATMEEYVIEDIEDSNPPRKRFKGDIYDTPKEVAVNEFILPLSTINALELFDEMVSKDQDVRIKVAAIIDDVISDDKTFRDIVRHIITDDVLESYSDNKAEIKNMYLFKVLLRDNYCKKREGKNFWRRFDSLFGLPFARRTHDGPIYETEDFRLPIKSIMELEELDRKVRVHPHIKAELVS